MKAISKSTQSQLLQFFFLVFFTSLVFSWRVPSSLSLVFILLLGLVQNNETRKQVFGNRNWNLLFIATAAFLLYQVAGLLYTTNLDAGWSNIRIKTGLLFVPLVVSYGLPGETMRKKLLSQFCILLFLASCYCLALSFWTFRQSGDVSVFFYHKLVKPIGQHAVYFSLLVIIALMFILEAVVKKEFVYRKWITAALLTWLSALLFFLSSKFVIALFLAYLAYYFITILKKNKPGRGYLMAFIAIILAITVMVSATKNPVRERFTDIFKGDITLIAQDQYNPGIYFNGLQFRLLQWRFVAEILSENHAWLTGVGAGDAQEALNKKYLSKNMYAGDGTANNAGYLAYNTHNQFLQTILQNGIFGLLLLLLICFCIAGIVFRQGQRLAALVFIVLITWLFIESAFETQYGIIIFMFFPLFLCHDTRLSIAR